MSKRLNPAENSPLLTSRDVTHNVGEAIRVGGDSEAQNAHAADDSSTFQLLFIMSGPLARLFPFRSGFNNHRHSFRLHFDILRFTLHGAMDCFGLSYSNLSHSAHQRPSQRHLVQEDRLDFLGYPPRSQKSRLWSCNIIMGYDIWASSCRHRRRGYLRG